MCLNFGNEYFKGVISVRICIVGNGSIGSYTALSLANNFPNANITLVGPSERKWAASTAAGAMANVYAEMEKSTGLVHETNLKYLEMGKYGSREWRKFLEASNGVNVITSEDTYVYLKKSHSEFEAKNYHAVTEAANQDAVLRKLDSNEIRRDFPSFASTTVLDAIRINGEFTFSVLNLFNHFEKLLQSSQINLISKNVEFIDLNKKTIILNSCEKSEIEYDLLVVCAGARSSTILEPNLMMPVFQGVGVAILLDGVKDLEMNKLRKGVFRSVNRGGAQCGIHLVPREDGKFYLGAGNYVSRVEDPRIRLDTVRYLLETLSKDLIGRNSGYELSGEFKLGLRPRALDGFPLIGPLADYPSVFVATGTNRAGLTWAPFIADEIAKWVGGKDLNPILDSWLPDRKPILFGTADEGINYFTESRISNALEHDLISKIDSEIVLKRSEFNKVAKQLCSEVNSKLSLPNDVSVNPDNWSAIMSSDL